MAGRDLGCIHARVRCVFTKPEKWEALPDEENLKPLAGIKSHGYISLKGNCLRRIVCVRAVWEGALYEWAV